MLFRKKTEMIAPEDALPGRDTPMPVSPEHVVLGTSIVGPFPDDLETIYVAMGCFWGAERIFWQLPGVYTTAVGYMGGWTPHPTYEESSTAQTGHTETVMVVFDPSQVTVDQLMKAFWENHDPTTPNRQGNDVGTQYRSAIYAISDEQLADARAGRDRFGAVLRSAHFGPITTEIAPAGPFFYAEDRHQQYLAVHPDGYCGLGGTGLVLGDPGSRRPGEGPTP